ncbi:MFS transporter [Paenibacillus lactis]|uniref:MFS transporter n=1 Tax=Paenibacillus lactis TaxID=228574 RepID=UPI0004B61D38
MDKRIFWLALGSFAIGTEGFMIGGLLPTLAAALHVSTALAGQLVTAFSLVYAVTSPLLTTLTGRMERRTLLFGSLLLLAVGNVVCGFASSYGWMLTGRIVAALGAGLFSPGAVAAASTLAAPEKRGRAVSIVVAGWADRLPDPGRPIRDVGRPDVRLAHDVLDRRRGNAARCTSYPAAVPSGGTGWGGRHT